MMKVITSQQQPPSNFFVNNAHKRRLLLPPLLQPLKKTLLAPQALLNLLLGPLIPGHLFRLQVHLHRHCRALPRFQYIKLVTYHWHDLLRVCHLLVILTLIQKTHQHLVLWSLPVKDTIHLLHPTIVSLVFKFSYSFLAIFGLVFAGTATSWFLAFYFPTRNSHWYGLMLDHWLMLASLYFYLLCTVHDDPHY